MKFTTSLLAGLALIAASAAATAPAAHAEEFTILIYETNAGLAARSDPARQDAYWNSYNRFAGELAQAGVLRGGRALSETTARTIDARGVRNTARSLRGTRTGGYFVIDVANLDEAVRWAKKAPGADRGVVEVRPHRANPTMSMGGAPAMTRPQ